ncbi:MAG TPA: glucose-1-phosphate adenylyltransferase [Pyrinomonadaceae bacterium]|jgi:glucose-1-phosphate adenylyltransferase|nr:glucose-1-phosphate adenylyltransferase [Pyrinomonadaceae bacterium]
MAPKKPNILAVILGGGAGTRLSPLTLTRSKPAVPLGGKYRLVDIPISNCINSDIQRIFVLTQYNSASLNKHISQTYRFSQFSNGFVEILAAEQTPTSPEWFQGTADAVRQVLPHIRDWGIDTLLILSGDHLYRMDYRKFLARHIETEADVTISVIPFVREQAEDFGLLKAETTGRILEFREKPKGQALEEMRVDTSAFGLSAEEAARRPFLASMGIYIFKYSLLEDFLARDSSWVDFGKQVIPAAISCCNVQAYMFDDYWEDIGTISAFHQANIDLTAVVPKFNLFDFEAPIYTRARYLPPSKINNCQFNQSIVAEGCIITRASLNRSIVGIRTRIDHGAQIENTYVMGADYYQSLDQMQGDARQGQPRVGIGEGTIIRNAIIDKNARIGAGVRLVNERGVREDTAPDGSWYIRDGIILVPKNAIIPDGTVV